VQLGQQPELFDPIGFEMSGNVAISVVNKVRNSLGPLNQQQLRCIEVMDNSGTHLLGSIDDVLDMAKIEAGKLELYCELTKIDKLCSDSLSFVKSQAFKKQIQMEVHVADRLPQLLVDERRIRQVLINLLANAVK
jgi:signal transduction histidine kinase